jgi:hypothetical protein
MDKAKSIGGKSLVFTFDKPPVNIIKGRLHTIRSINDILQSRKVIRLSDKGAKVNIPSEINPNMKYTIIWVIFEGASSSAQRNYQNLLSAWSDAGLRTGFVHVDVTGSYSKINIVNADEIHLNNFSSHLLRGDLISAIEIASNDYDRVLIICEHEKAPVGAIALMRQLPATLVIIAKLGETLKTDAEIVRTVGQPDLLLLE